MTELTVAQEVNNSEIVPALTAAQELQVVDVKSMAVAVEIIRGIKFGKGKIEDTFDKHVKAAHKAHKDLLATVKEFTEPIDEAENLLREKIFAHAVKSGDVVKGVTIKSKWALSEVPDDAAMLAIMKLVIKGTLPLGLLKLDGKIALELAKAGVVIPGVVAEDVQSLAVR